jgi:hypothetical protein
MTDPDTFAAAALTGLLPKDDAAKPESMAPWWPEWVCAAAYRWADAMLREQERHHIPDAGKMIENTTNHDAAPEARAVDADRGRTDKAVTRPGDGTGNTPSKAEIDALEFVVEEGRTGSVDDYGILRSWLIRMRPEWEHQSYEESDEKRVNTNTNRDTTPGEGSVQSKGTIGERLVERFSITQAMLDDNEKLRAEIDRLREALRCLADQDATLSVQDGGVTVTMDATLTKKERKAVAFAAEHFGAFKNQAATLRKLLERLD